MAVLRAASASIAAGRTQAGLLEHERREHQADQRRQREELEQKRAFRRAEIRRLQSELEEHELEERAAEKLLQEAEQRASQEREEAAKRAQQEREEAEKRAQQEREEAAKRAQQEREEAEKRAQQEREEAAKRAQQEREEAEKRAQQEREEAEKRAQQEREEAAKRAQAEQWEKEELARQEVERAEAVRIESFKKRVVGCLVCSLDVANLEGAVAIARRVADECAAALTNADLSDPVVLMRKAEAAARQHALAALQDADTQPDGVALALRQTESPAPHDNAASPPAEVARVTADLKSLEAEAEEDQREIERLQKRQEQRLLKQRDVAKTALLARSKSQQSPLQEKDPGRVREELAGKVLDKAKDDVRQSLQLPPTPASLEPEFSGTMALDDDGEPQLCKLDGLPTCFFLQVCTRL